MKIIFLDIDGVLNSREYDRRRDWSKQTAIDETRLPFVKQIIDATGAVIVLSSTWRIHWNADKNKCREDGVYITELFAKYGVEIYDKTPDLGINGDRADEIREYLTTCGEDIESYVIIDDCRYDWREMNDRFVKTSPYRTLGIDEETTALAIKILNNKID
ncbi:MAG: hypothetical protein HDT28_05400 [Clostridiales bacterium]|nr:hypothetical protein [Clostridiales bacterium]